MANKDNEFQGVVESLLKGMDSVLSAKTVIGEATKVGDTIILPLVDVTFGVGAGAGSNTQKGSGSGAGGLGGKMPVFSVNGDSVFGLHERVNKLNLFLARMSRNVSILENNVCALD